MKRLKTLVLSIALVLSTLVPALAVNRVQWPAQIQPPSNWMNTMGKNNEYGIGQLFWDIVGRSNNGMVYTNLTVSPQSGLYLTVGPSVANTIGSVYAVYAADLNPFGTGAGQIPADPTLLFHQGFLLSNTPAIGPLTPTVSVGQSTAFTIECQVQTVDQTLQTVNFVSPTNVASSGAANRDRADVVVCQATTGVSGVSPTPPAADAGWLKVGTAVIPQGTTTITAGMLTQGVPFNGFLPNGSAATFMDLTNVQTANGNKTFTGITAFNNAIKFTGAPAVLTTSPGYESDGQASPGLLVNTATGSNGVQYTTNGVLNGAVITAGGVFKATSSLYGPSSALVNGNISTLAASQGFQLNNGTNGWGVFSQAAVNAPFIGCIGTAQACPLTLYTNGASSASTGTFDSTGKYTTGSSYYGPTGAAVNGPVNLPLVAAGVCLTTDASHNIISAGGACGLASGTITSVTGTAPITATTASGAVTVGISPTPTFNSATLGTAATAGSLCLGTDGNLCATRSGGTVTWTGLAGVTPIIAASGGFQSGSSSYFPNYATVNGTITGTQFNGSGAGLTSATVPNAALVTPALTSVTCSLNVTCGTGTTPTIQLIASPTFSGSVSANGFTAGSSTYSVTNATVNGTIYANAPANTTGLAADNAGIANQALAAATNPGVSVYGSGTGDVYGMKLWGDGSAFYTGVYANGGSGGIAFLSTTTAGTAPTTNGGFNLLAKINSSGQLVTGLSSYGPTSATVNGALNIIGTTHNWAQSVDTSDNLLFNYNGGTRAYLTTSGVYAAGLSSYGPTSATVNGSISATTGYQIGGVNAFINSGGYTYMYSPSAGFIFHLNSPGSDIASMPAAGGFNLAAGSFTAGGSTFGASATVNGGIRVNGTAASSGSSANLLSFPAFSGGDFDIWSDSSANYLNFGFNGGGGANEKLKMDASGNLTSLGGLTVNGNIQNTTSQLNLVTDGGPAAVLVNYQAGGTAGLGVYNGGTTNYGSINVNGFQTGGSTYGPTSATVNGGITLGAGDIAWGTNLGYGPHWSPPGQELKIYDASSPTNEIIFGQSGGGAYSPFLTVTSGGNVTAIGAMTATNYYNGSRREWKTDIHSVDNLDPFSVLPTHWYSYRYNKAHGGHPTDSLKYGYMANDTDARLAGPKHDRYDLGNTLAFTAMATENLNKRVKALESRGHLGGPITINGTTHDPRVTALEAQVHQLWVLLALVFALVILLFAIIIAVLVKLERKP